MSVACWPSLEGIQNKNENSSKWKVASKPFRIVSCGLMTPQPLKIQDGFACTERVIYSIEKDFIAPVNWCSTFKYRI